MDTTATAPPPSVSSVPEKVLLPTLSPAELYSNFNLEIRERILQLLEIFPKLSPSMLQVGLGPGRDPRLWRSILQNLIDEGKITVNQVSVTTPKGRCQVVTLLELAPKKVAEPEVNA